jgi:hypothetical protein
MKRGILLATVVVLVTGAAGAHLLTKTSQATTAKPSAALSLPEKPAPGKVLLSEPAKVVSQPAPAPVLRGASVDVRQAPVPMQVKPRKPVVLREDTPGTQAKTDVGAPAEPAMDDKANDAAARAAIAADGYKDVQILRKDKGVWHAKALRGKTAVLLTVDSSGAVTTAD